MLIRWMGDNIAYDVSYLETGERGDYSVENVLKTGRAVCQGYSDVLVQLCKYGLKIFFFTLNNGCTKIAPLTANTDAKAMSPCARFGVRLPPRLAGCAVQYTPGVHGGIDNFPATILRVYTMTASRMLKVSQL